MKKIIRRIFLCLLAVVVIAGSAGAYYLFGRKGPGIEGKIVVTDAQGNSYLAVVDNKSGETMFAVTDANGNIGAAVTDSAGNIGSTVADLNGVVNKEDLPTNYTGPSIDVTVNGNDYTGVIDSNDPNTQSTTAPTTAGSTAENSTAANTTANNVPESTTSSNKPTTTKNQDEKLTAYRIEKYQKIFSGGTYLMEFTTNDADLGDTPITAAVKNNNIYINTKIQSMNCKMLYIAGTGGKAGTTYLIIDDFKKYCKMPEDFMDGNDMDMSNLMGSADSASSKNITVSKVSAGNKTLICESYKDKDGTTVKYYFDGETLVRRDNVNNDGTVDSTFISRITTDVPDSLFEIPKNYGYLNLSFLSGLMGDN